MNLKRKLGFLALTAGLCLANFSEQAYAGTAVTKIEIPPIVTKIHTELKTDVIKVISFVVFPLYSQILNFVYSDWSECMNSGKIKMSFSFKCGPHIKIQHTMVKKPR